jgi:hypothetical protein
MQQVADVANGATLWALSILVVSVVVVQALIFMRMSLRFSDRFGILDAREKRAVYKTATINSIGPAVAIFFVAISLIALIGGPMTLMRVGVIGSAVFELYAAGQGAVAAGAQIGTESYTLTAFTASVWAMTLGGMGWLVTAFVFTRRLGNAQTSLKKRNPALLLIMGSVTPIAIFGVLAANTAIQKSGLTAISVRPDHLCAVLAAAGGMLAFRLIGAHLPWVREWALGFSLILGLGAGYAAGQVLA